MFNCWSSLQLFLTISFLPWSDMSLLGRLWCFPAKSLALSSKTSNAFFQLIEDTSCLSNQHDCVTELFRGSAFIFGSFVWPLLCFLYSLEPLSSPLMGGKLKSGLFPSLCSVPSLTEISGSFKTCWIASFSSLYMKCPGISFSSSPKPSLTLVSVSKEILPSFRRYLLRPTFRDWRVFIMCALKNWQCTAESHLRYKYFWNNFP